MQQFESNNYQLVNRNDSPDKQRIMNQKFSTMISTYGALAHYLPGTGIQNILNSFGEVLLRYSALEHVEPLLQTSICEFAYYIVTSKTGLSSNTCIEAVFIAMDKLSELLKYMVDTHANGKNFEKYKRLCEDAEMYNKGTLLLGEPVPLESMTNPVIHSLFISIIKLITFISKYALLPGHIQDKCQYFAAHLNDIERENALFACLQIPNDDVKLAIAKCLDEVSISQIEVDELSFFTRLLSSYKNLGAGKTEEVLYCHLNLVNHDQGAVVDLPHYD